MKKKKKKTKLLKKTWPTFSFLRLRVAPFLFACERSHTHLNDRHVYACFPLRTKVTWKFKRLLIKQLINMEANKEKRELVEKKEEIEGKKKNDGVESATGFDPMTKILIHKSIITDGDTSDSIVGKECSDHNVAEAPDDVLAFSRSVHKIDSSLEWIISKYIVLYYINDNHIFFACSFMLCYVVIVS